MSAWCSATACEYPGASSLLPSTTLTPTPPSHLPRPTPHSFDGFRGFCQRASFKSAQGAFFLLSYIGFIALTGALLGTGALAGFSLMANQACDSVARASLRPKTGCLGFPSLC